jgi:hypothetical protein
MVVNRGSNCCKNGANFRLRNESSSLPQETWGIANRSEQQRVTAAALLQARLENRYKLETG